MVSEHKRYVRQEKARDDKMQTIFSPWGEVEPRHKPKVEAIFTGDMNMMVACPFCLNSGRLQIFLVSTKKGISQSNAECPECHNGMKMKSLTADWTPEQYADWVYAYRLSGFWQKCPFATWKKRLKNSGIAGQFWERYKALKGDTDTPAYTKEENDAYNDMLTNTAGD